MTPIVVDDMAALVWEDVCSAQPLPVRSDPEESGMSSPLLPAS